MQQLRSSRQRRPVLERSAKLQPALLELPLWACERQPVGLRVVELDRSGVGKLGQPGAILVELRDERRVGDGDGDHLAAFLRLADRKHFHARAGLRERPHVFVNLRTVGQLARRAGDIAENRLGRRNGLRGGQVIDERREEERRGRVFLDLPGVLLVDRLLGIGSPPGLLGMHEASGDDGNQAGEQESERHLAGHDSPRGGDGHAREAVKGILLQRSFLTRRGCASRGERRP